jgi:serine/threonine protein kinase
MDLRNSHAIPSCPETPLSDELACLSKHETSSSCFPAGSAPDANLSQRVLESHSLNRGEVPADPKSSTSSANDLSTSADFDFERKELWANRFHACSPNDSILETLDPVGRDADLPDTTKIGGHFVLESELGHGSSGTVFRAFDERLQRSVAIKIIHQPLTGDSSDFENSFAEARSLAKLPHAGIVQIFEVGETSVSPFLVTELIDGPSLRELVQQPTGVNFQTAAELVRQIAVALEFAHKNGVLHRDLKPSNILLTSTQPSTKPVSCDPKTWHAKITDFGLAQKLDDARSGSGQIVGTPAYMSPEAASGSNEKVDARSDLFSLGIIFYELLTKQLPFIGTLDETLAQVRKCDVAPPRSIDPKIPADLEAICLKCLQKAPEERYATASDLQTDLQNWLHGRTVSARTTPLVERAVKWYRRQPVLASALITTAALILLVGGLSLSIYSLRRLHAQNELTRKIDYLIATEQALDEPLREIRNSPEARQAVLVRLRRRDISPAARTRLLLVDGPQTEEEVQFLWRRLVEQGASNEFEPIVKWLAPHQETLRPTLEGETDDERALRVSLTVLAWPASPAVREAAIKNLAELISNTSFKERWLPHLAPYRSEIIARLVEEYQPDGHTLNYCDTGCKTLCQLCHDDTELLCSLLQVVDHDDVSTVCDALASNRAEAIEHLSSQASFYASGRSGNKSPSPKTPFAQEGDAFLAINRLTRTLVALAQLSTSAEEWQHYFEVDDPRVEAYFILGAVDQGLNAEKIANLLAQKPRPLAHRAVILAMNGLRHRQFNSHPTLLARLKDEYENNTCAGVHSAIRYCFEKFEHADVAIAIDKKWKNKRRPGFNWYVDDLGQTMVILPFKLPCIDNGMDEPLTVAIASTEITYRQLSSMKYSTYNPATGKSPKNNTAAQLVKLHKALDFCRSLDDLEQLDDDQRAVTKELNSLSPSQTALLTSAGNSTSPLYQIDRRKIGYRLPTSIELEQAAELKLFADAWEKDNDPAWLGCYFHPRPYHPVTEPYSRMPNRLGFFHSLGNVWEWTIENDLREPPDHRIHQILAGDRLRLLAGPINQANHSLFGKSSAAFPIHLDHSCAGFRVVRTLKQGSGAP